MTLKPRTEFILVNLLSAGLLVSIILFPDNPLRLALGIVFGLFLPGYALISALFTRKTSLSPTARITWSLGLSLALVPLIGLILNFTSAGITVEGISGTLAAFILIFSSVSWYRRKNLPPDERDHISFKLTGILQGKSLLDRVLLLVLAAAVLGMAGFIVYRLNSPTELDKMTEFYLLNEDSVPDDYPAALAAGQEATVVIGVRNNEYRDITYRLEVSINGSRVQTIQPVPLVQGETWENPVTFTVPAGSSNRTKILFTLYEADDAEPMLEPLYFWVAVTR